jgi:hypothetical protein
MGLRIDVYNPTRIIKLLAADKRDGVVDEATGKPLLNRYYTLRLAPQPKVENGQLYWELLITRDPTF